MRRAYRKSIAYKPVVHKRPPVDVGMDFRDRALRNLTVDELRRQLELTLSEHKRLDDESSASQRIYVDSWYSSICAEFRRREMNDELEFRVHEYRTKKK